MSVSTYAERRARLAAELAGARGETVRLAKATSNLFRDREPAGRRRLDVRAFSHVLEVNPDARWVDAEGMTPYEALLDATLAHGFMPAVVPQLKSITLGGAAAGVGIEASSFRYGLVHETVQEMDVLLPDGRVVLCTPHNEHAELFFGFPNSYGTLGYALRLRAMLVPVQPYVELEHRRHRDARAFFADLAGCCGGDADFVEGVVFGRDRQVLTLGRFRTEAPWASDYTYERIYYRSLLERTTDFMRVHDYLWRWDSDWFWCSKNLGAQYPPLRRLLGRARLNSVFYTRVMRWNSRWGLTRRLDRLRGLHRESVIQDVDLPVEHAPEFLEFLLEAIGILPIWICPTRALRPGARYPLFPMTPGALYVNFGFWDVVRTTREHEPGHFNRLIERRVQASGGIKSLYSDAYYAEDEFWRIYDRGAYEALKRRYDPGGVLLDLYRKCVLRQ